MPLKGFKHSAETKQRMRDAHLKEKICGVYLVVSWVNKTHYIGSSRNCRTRWIAHKTQMRCGAHKYFNDFILSYRKNHLTFFILEKFSDSVSNAKLLEREQEWANSFPQRVNRYKHVTGKGHAISAQTRKILSSKMLGNQRLLGYVPSKATREKLSRAGKGLKRSAATCAKISRALIGNKYGVGHKISPKHKEKLRIANLLKNARKKLPG